MVDDGVSEVLSLATNTSDGQVVITLQGEIDVATVGTLEHRFTAIKSTDCTVVVVDLAEVTFIDCTGLKALEIARRNLARVGIRLAVRNPQRQARRLFQIALADEPLEEIAGPNC